MSLGILPLADGTAYVVTITTQPVGQTCTVTNGAGTLAGSNVSNVAVICTNDPGVLPTVAVPTLSESAIIILFLLLMMVGLVQMRWMT